MSEQLEVLLTASYCLDIILTDLPAFPRLGSEIFCGGMDISPGGAFNSALALHRLGVRTRWVCDFGNDFASRFVLDAVKDAGIDSSLFHMHQEARRFVTVALSYPDDRAFISYTDRYERLLPTAEIERYRPRWLFLPHAYSGPQALEGVKVAHEAGCSVFMDCQSTALTLSSPDLVDMLHSVDVFAPNAAEALQLTGAHSLDNALSQLAEITPLVIIKQGAKGAVARRGDEVVVSPAFSAKVVDTTAAGDCFNAGFLYGMLRGMPLAACLLCANICGGLSTTMRGCLATPTAEQLATLVARFPAAQE
jgi:sugar/nucleoside kinase (ribokinase family)